MMMMMMMSELARQCRMACFSHEMLTPQNSNVLVLAWAPPVGPALEDKTTGFVVTFRPCSASPQGLICRNIVAPLGWGRSSRRRRQTRRPPARHGALPRLLPRKLRASVLQGFAAHAKLGGLVAFAHRGNASASTEGWASWYPSAPSVRQ